jgi:hypothetical protein
VSANALQDNLAAARRRLEQARSRRIKTQGVGRYFVLGGDNRRRTLVRQMLSIALTTVDVRWLVLIDKAPEPEKLGASHCSSLFTDIARQVVVETKIGPVALEGERWAMLQVMSRAVLRKDVNGATGFIWRA